MFLKRSCPIIAVLVLCQLISFSQIKVTGAVSDSLKHPLANVTVSIKENNTILKFAKTDAEGNFSFNLASDYSLEGRSLEAKSLGFLPAQFELHPNQSVYNFVLKESIINLKEVNVKHKPIITERGDTLNYRPSDFSNQNDRSIGDVLKKMPGIAVDDNGKVTYNNKAISQLYLDGDNLLDDKYNIATKSISHKVVTKVQVIEHDQPIKMLQKNNLSDEVAINLVIDSNAKLNVIGNASLGAGVPDKYQENVDLVLFKNTFKFLDNIALNNTGIDLSDDVISHNILKKNPSDNDRPGFQISTGIGATPFLPKARHLINNSGIINTNNLYKLSPEKQLKANIYYLYDRQKQFNNYATQITLPDENIYFAEDRNNRTLNQSIYSQLNYIDNATNHYINDSFTIDYSPHTNHGAIRGQTTPFEESLYQKSLNLVNNLQYLQTLKSGTILNLNSYIEKTNQTELLGINPGINAGVLNENVAYSELNQKVNIPGFFTNNFITYSIRSGRFTQSYQAGFSYQSIDFNSDLSLTQSDQSKDTFPNGSNEIHWNKFKTYLNPGLDYMSEDLLLSIRMPLSLNILNYNQNNGHHTKIFANPSLSLRFTIDQENQLNANYAFSDNQGKVQDIFGGFVLQNYRSLVANNIPLPFTKSHYASFGYQFKKAVSLLFANIQATYNNIIYDNIGDNTVYNSIQTRTSIQLRNSSNNLSLSGSIGKYFTGINTNFSLNTGISRSDGKLLQNNELFTYVSKSVTFGPGFSTKITRNIDMSYNGSYSRLNTDIAHISGPQTDQLRQAFKLNTTFFKKITVGADLTHIYLKQTNQPQLNYLFTDMNLKFKWLKLKTDFELGLNNLSNIRSFDTYSTNLNTFSASHYTIPGRNILLKAFFSIK